MAKHSAAYSKAHEKMEDVLGAIGAIYTANTKVLQQYDHLLALRDEAVDELKAAAKADAEKNADFRKFEGAGFYGDIIPTRKVDVISLEKIIGKVVTDVKGLSKTKITVDVPSVEKLVEADVIPAKALTAIGIDSYSVKFCLGLREDKKK